jgi:hypothetical protein
MMDARHPIINDVRICDFPVIARLNSRRVPFRDRLEAAIWNAQGVQARLGSRGGKRALGAEA